MGECRVLRQKSVVACVLSYGVVLLNNETGLENILLMTRVYLRVILTASVV